MYEGDAPLAERRAAALSLDRDLLRDLLGSQDLRELLDPAALDAVELELQRLADGRAARTIDGIHDSCATRSAERDRDRGAQPDGRADAIDRLVAEYRDPRRIAGANTWRRSRTPPASGTRSALGSRPVSLPRSSGRRPAARTSDRALRPHARPFRGRRRCRSSRRRRRAGPPVPGSARGGRSRRARRVPAGRLRAGSGAMPTCCADSTPSLAALRQEIEPVDAAAFARFLPAGRASTGRGEALRSPRCSNGSREWRSRPRSSSATCCPPGSRVSVPPISTR